MAAQPRQRRPAARRRPARRLAAARHARPGRRSFHRTDYDIAGAAGGDPRRRPAGLARRAARVRSVACSPRCGRLKVAPPPRARAAPPPCSSPAAIAAGCSPARRRGSLQDALDAVQSACADGELGHAARRGAELRRPRATRCRRDGRPAPEREPPGAAPPRSRRSSRARCTGTPTTTTTPTARRPTTPTTTATDDDHDDRADHAHDADDPDADRHRRRRPRRRRQRRRTATDDAGQQRRRAGSAAAPRPAGQEAEGDGA